MESIALTEAVYYILLSLGQPLHGYGIMQNVEQLSHGRVRLAAGTLYGALNTMVSKGWIEALDGEASSRKKEYVITAEGRRVVRQELERLQELTRNGETVIGGWQHG
ncbi:MAG: PadR family transcriptional regulator [Aristaeellaceae bacterium]